MPIAVINAILTVLFSLGFGQTANLDVLAVTAPTAVTADSAQAKLKTAKGICDITLTFFDGQSNQLMTNEVWINPGSSASLSLPSSKIPRKGDGLAYGEVDLLTDSDPSCAIKPSLDIAGPAGETTVLIPLAGNAAAYFGPEPASN